MQHGAADAGVFVLAGCSVGASAGTKFYLPMVEMLLELVPLLLRRVPVFTSGSSLSPLVDMGLIVTNDVFIEHSDVAAGGLDVEMAEQSRPDVDR